MADLSAGDSLAAAAISAADLEVAVDMSAPDFEAVAAGTPVAATAAADKPRLSISGRYSSSPDCQ